MSSLSVAQIELNCRRLLSYDIDKLKADEFGTLHPYLSILSNDICTAKFDGTVPLSTQRFVNIKPAILATLEGIRAEMERVPPVTFFMMPFFNYYFYFIPVIETKSCSFKALLARLQITSMIKDDEEILRVVQNVKQLYNSVDFGIISRSSTQERTQFNLYVKAQIRTLSQGVLDHESKAQKLHALINTIRSAYMSNYFWDEHSQSSKTIEWITSGRWRNQQFRMNNAN